MAKFATNASGAIWWPYLQLMQVAPSGGQICNYCKWRHLVAKFATNVKWRHLVSIFATNASDAIWWPNLQLMQVASSCGQICNECKWCHVVALFSPSHEVNFWVRCASGNVSIYLKLREVWKKEAIAYFAEVCALF